MSVYNGFGTRSQENAYNKSLYNLAFLMQHTVVQFLEQSDEFDHDRFKRYFVKLVMRLHSLEEYKYLPPKYSCAYDSLLTHFRIDKKEYAPSNSKQRLIKTSYNKRASRKSRSRSSSRDSSTSSMLQYYNQKGENHFHLRKFDILRILKGNIFIMNNSFWANLMIY